MTTSSDYIALASAAIAVCALGVSLWQGYLTRLHNVLSVRPHVEVLFRGVYDEDQVKITLINNGLGPALITSLLAHHDGRTFPLNSDDSFSDLANLIAGSLPHTLEYLLPDAVTSLAPRSSMDLMVLRSSAADPAVRASGQAQLAEGIHSVAVSVLYKCMYGNGHITRSGKSAA